MHCAIRNPGVPALVGLSALTLAVSISSCGGDDDKTPVGPGPDVPATTRSFAPNRLSAHLSHNGRGLSATPGGDLVNAVLYGSSSVLFDHGLWLGAVVGGQERVTASAYFAGECRPLPRGNDAGSTLVYILEPEDTVGDPDYDQWPLAAGAPRTQAGTPAVFGSATAWAAFDDLDPLTHEVLNGVPLGAEIRETVWADAAFETVLFYRFEVKNVSINPWSEVYLAAWSDVDLGLASNDVVGCDLTRHLGYVYTDSNHPEVVADGKQPAVGFCLLKTPGDVGMYAFPKLYKNIDEPETVAEAMNVLRGKLKTGEAFIDSVTTLPTRYWASGDPVTGSGFVDRQSGDRRVLLSTGAFGVAPGETIVVTYAVILALGVDALQAVTQLGTLTDQVRGDAAAWDY